MSGRTGWSCPPDGLSCSEKSIKQIKVDMCFRQAEYQAEFFAVGSGDFGYVLGDYAVQTGSSLLFGAHVGNIAAIKDHLRDATDRGNAGDDQTDNPGSVFGDLVEICQCHQGAGSKPALLQSPPKAGGSGTAPFRPFGSYISWLIDFQKRLCHLGRAGRYADAALL